ncbi:hypothetical protein HYV79_05325 [Candidatus Woesearchaeota archaeon]|nr:hypothetical protein [Candidatus Woesearchaeota archaeon]
MCQKKEDCKQKHLKNDEEKASNMLFNEKNKKNLEEIIKENKIKRHFEKTNYSLTDVLKHPIKYSSGGFQEAWDDLNYSVYSCVNISKTKTESLTKFFGLNAGLLTFFGIWAVPHELIHAGVNKLTGGINKEIVINSLYGGSIISKYFSEIQSKLMLPFIGGYVVPENNSDLGLVAMALAPYVLTPLGLCIAKKGRENKNLLTALFGSALIAAHLGGVVGDFWSVGRTIMLKGLEMLYFGLGENTSKLPEEANLLELSFLLLGGFYIGSKVMGYSYRLCKGAFNSINQAFHNSSPT